MYEYSRSNPMILTDPLGGCSGKEKEKESKPCKCFCLERLDLGHVKTINTGEFIGAQFTVTITGEWKCSDKFAPPHIEWWEYNEYPATFYKGEDRTPRIWHEFFSKYEKNLTQHDPTYKTIKNKYTLRDKPGIKPGRIGKDDDDFWTTQTSYFAIRVASAPGCDCDRDYMTVYAQHKYKVWDKHVEYNTFQPNAPPPSPPGEPPYKYP